MFNNNSGSSTKKANRFKASSVNSPLTNELYSNFSSKKVNLLELNKHTAASKLSHNNEASNKQSGVGVINVHSSGSTTVTTSYIAKSRKDQGTFVYFLFKCFAILFNVNF